MTQSKEVVTLKIEDLLIEKHEDLLLDVLDHRHTHYSCNGGRGGAKSSAIGKIIPLVMAMPENRDVHAVVFRKVANTLRDSVFAEISSGISMLGLDHYWKRTVSPMEMTYLPTGQKILFRGADEPEKIKSIKAPFGYFGITWFEELDQYNGREEIRNILQSTMRGKGGRFWNFESFNPPISRNNWANQDLLLDILDRLITKSCYLEVPQEWLSEQFYIEAEKLKQLNYRAYEHEYLGVPTGTGGNVFENVIIQTIPNAMWRRFDRIYQGIDWGWFPDPFAFIRLHYDSNRETVFILDEHCVNKRSNEETSRWITGKKYHTLLTTCDSAEPKSVHDMKNAGLKVAGAVKGPGSVEYSMKWLQRRKIVIDPKRTPFAAKEFLEYEYERNKEGEIITGYPDKNNHLIDAARYALEAIMLSSKTVA
jgi:PBSX family phage terminase large subunit